MNKKELLLLYLYDDDIVFLYHILNFMQHKRNDNNNKYLYIYTISFRFKK